MLSGYVMDILKVISIKKQEREENIMETITKRDFDVAQKVIHHYHMLDAQQQIKDFFSLDWDVSIPSAVEDLFNLDGLAEDFELGHDCNVADNDQWQGLIARRVEEMTDDEKSVIKRHGLSW